MPRTVSKASRGNSNNAGGFDVKDPPSIPPSVEGVTVGVLIYLRDDTELHARDDCYQVGHAADSDVDVLRSLIHPQMPLAVG